MLRTTVSRNPRHPGYKFILQMIESFSLMSENGVHRCLTFEFMGPSLLTLLTQSGFQGIQEDAVKNIMKQVRYGFWGAFWTWQLNAILGAAGAGIFT